MKQELLVLCVNCEEYTGHKALRPLTPEGCCYTCGSRSVLRQPAPRWIWTLDNLDNRPKLVDVVRRGA